MTVPNVRNVLGASPPATLPDPDGVCAIIASSQKGTLNLPSGYFDYNVALGDFGYGLSTEVAAQVQPTAKKKFIIIRPATSVAATYSAFVFTGTGTSVPTAHAADHPQDDFDVQIKIPIGGGGTVGTGPISYQVSLDGGKTFGPVTALGTATKIEPANTGVGVDLAAGTLAAGDLITFTTTAARPNDSDLTAALAALKASSQPWETLYIYMDATHTTVNACDAWLQTLEANNVYQRSVVLNWRRRAKDGSESEAAYNAAFQTEFGSTQTPRVLVCADEYEASSTLISLPGRATARRPVGVCTLARGMSVDISIDLAEQDLGALSNVTIDDGDGNPLYHDENKNPGLDDSRATTLRSFNGYTGAYINNARLLSDPASKYKYWQHIRIVGRARDVSTRKLISRLSKGVRVDRKSGFILEADAQEIDGLVNDVLKREFITSNPVRLSDVLFTLSRTDDLSSDEPVLTGSLQLVFKKYVKGFLVTTTIVETIST